MGEETLKQVAIISLVTSTPSQTIIKENVVFSPLLWGEVGALAPGEGV